jgi:hypothetical protein
MKRCITAVVGLFALLVMAMPSVASAGVVIVRPERVRPAVVQEAVAPDVVPAPFTTVEYYRPWACSNPYFRHHHWWRCR